MTEAQKRAKGKYQQKVKRIAIDFYPTEADLLEHISKQPKKQTYIKDLIRADMQKSLTVHIDGNQIAAAAKQAFPGLFSK